jgi:hypothetical protein
LYEIMHSDREQLHKMHTSDERCTLANRAHHMLQTGDWLEFVKCVWTLAHGPDERCTLANRAHHILQTGDWLEFVKCVWTLAHGPRV